MEIVTYVLAGELEHVDSQGHQGVIHPGEVQVMSAGKGIRHSEYNHSKKEPVHLVQLWILPRKLAQKPRWDQRPFSSHARSGKLLPVVSDGSLPETLVIDQEAQIYVSSLQGEQEVTHHSRPGRKAYLFASAGALTVNGRPLAEGDQARIADESELEIHGAKNAELILLDLPEVRG